VVLGEFFTGYSDMFRKLGILSCTMARRIFTHMEGEGPPAMSVPSAILRRERLGWAFAIENLPSGGGGGL